MERERQSGACSPRFQGCCKDFVSSQMGSNCRKFEDRVQDVTDFLKNAPWPPCGEWPVGARVKQRGQLEDDCSCCPVLCCPSRPKNRVKGLRLLSKSPNNLRA